MATTITKDFPPDAQLKRVSQTLTTSWATLVEPSNYDALENPQFGSERAIVTGAAEITSALLLSNRAGAARTASVRITRANGDVSVLLNNYEIQPNDAVPIPLNGQALINDSGVEDGTGDKLEVVASAADSIDATLTYTVGKIEEGTNAA